jgi:pimeloyl-ACP methyl ester carboxylesterase
VIWSDIVNQASVLAATMAATGGAPPAEQARQQTAEAIKDALRDRADQHVLHSAASTNGHAIGPLAATDLDGLISIPGLNCIDDFSIYLTDDTVRQQIIDRCIAVVQPALQAGLELDIIAHSWGTVVAYEALRQLEDEGLQSPLVRNFFTVGAALSIGPVKMQLRGANKNGKKPASVRRWVNLNAHGDIIGGALKGRPYDDDVDVIKLAPFGCKSVLGLVNPVCAHSSYFASGNVAVNRDLFANYIGQP